MASFFANCPVSPTKLMNAAKCRYVQYGMGLLAVGFLGLQVRAWRKASALKADQANFKKDTIYMYSFPRTKTLGVISPGCMKLEVFLRLAKLPYVFIPTMDTSMSPTGRLPCIVYNGETTADSGVIIDKLTKEKNIALDKALTADQIHTGLLLKHTCELGGWIFNERMAMVENGTLLLEKVLQNDMGMSKFKATQGAKMFRKSIIKFLNNHGNGDVPTFQCDLELLAEVKALEHNVRKNGGFAAAEKPSTADCVAYAFISQVAGAAQLGLKGQAYDYTRKSEVLQNYIRTLEGVVYPDLAGLNHNMQRQTFN